jgi:PAS domain S-box-containing protein
MHSRQAAESALLESEERYRAVIAALEEGIVIYEADGTISGCNASACRILGMSEPEICRRTAREPGWRAVREDGSPFEPESHPAAITLLTGLPCSHVVMGIERPGSSRVWVSINSRPLCRPGNEDPYAVAVSLTDITRTKQVEEELLRRACQQSAIAELGRHALEGTAVDVLLDEAVRRVASVLEVEQCKVEEQLPGQKKLRLRASLARPAGRPRLTSLSVPVPGRDGWWGLLSAHTASPRTFSPEEEQFLQAVANVLAVAIERQRDQEEQQKLQDAIRKSAVEWRLTFDAITHPVMLLEMDGRIVRVNEAARDLAGLTYEQVLHRPVAFLWSAEPWRAICTLLPQVEATAEAASAQARDDEGRTWDVSLSPVTSPDDQRGVVVVARDITDLVRLQESLRRSETMSAMGALVAGVAHEVRNPLFGISATLDAFASRFKRRTEYRRYVDILQGEVGRLSELMQQLLDYGKPFRLVVAPESPREVMRAALAACEPSAAKARVTLAIEVEPGLPPLPMDRNRIVQVFQNLLENAVQHSQPGARVLFRAARASRDDRDGICFSVEDSGPGFRTEDLPHIFEPFFTRRRGGTGLGLSIVQRIVEHHEGAIVPANRPDGGAAVAVILPFASHALPKWERVV